jgi:hypothetical protein
MLKQRFVKPKIDKFIQLYSRNAKLEEVNSTGVVTDLILTEKGYWYLYPPDVTFTGGGGSGASAVAIVDNEYNLDLTSLKLTNEGTGYITQPNVVITPKPAIDGISSIPVSTAGMYSLAPIVSISGGTPVVNAVATVNIGSGSVIGVSISNGGTGYSGVPDVVFSAPTSGVTAVGIATVVGGIVTAITMTNFGSGYTSAPTISFNGATFTTTAVASPIMGGPITSITMSNQGRQYSLPPTVSLTRAPTERDGLGIGVNAGTLGAPVFTRYVYDVFINNGGTGYTNGSAVTFTGGNPSVPASGTAIVTNGVIVGVNFTNNGSGYTSAPTAQFTGGTGASGTPIIDFGIFATARAKMARAGHRVYKYVWDLDESVVIDENAILQVVDRQYIIQNRDMGEPDVITEKPIVVRIHEIGTKSIVNAKNLPNNDFTSGKIIDIGKPNRFLPNDIKLELNGEIINRIVLSLDYDITRRTGFIKDDEFVIILKIAEKEPSLIEYGSLNNINITQ